MGCDSNLPDYRSANGFWKQYPPLVKAGVTMKVSVTTNKKRIIVIILIPFHC